MEHIWATVLGLTGLLAIAVLILPAARRLSVPYTVLLAVFGCGLGVVGLVVETHRWGFLGDFLEALHGFEITSEAVLFIFLPALVFEAALSINVRRLLDDLAPILALAVIGFLLSTAIIGMTMSLISGVSLIVCLLLGAIGSATDPVAVVAIFKDLGAPKRLAILVEGESLFNDATAIVGFTILATMLRGEADPGVLSGAASFVQVFAGGGLVGYLLARGLCRLLKRLRGVPLVEITLTISLAYLSFIIAEHYLEVSGVVAVVVAALVLGSYGRTVISPRTWHGLNNTWEQIGFWANTLIFVLVGLAVPSILKDVSRSEVSWIAAVIAAALVARAVVIYGLLPVFNWFGMRQRVSMAYKTVMFWGGLRGAVSLALALAIMENDAYDAESQRFIGVMVTGLVLFTLFVNAPTMLALLKLLGLDKLPPAELAVRNRAMALSLSNIGETIERTAAVQGLAPGVADDVASSYSNRLAQAQATVDELHGISEDDWVAIGLSTLGNQERKACLQFYADGFIASNVARQLLGQVDDILDGVKSHGVDGYQSAVDERLRFGTGFHLAMWAQQRLGRTGPLAQRLADRFEVLLATCTILTELHASGLPQVESMVGERTGKRLQSLLEKRQRSTEQALSALRLQYPDYARVLQERYLGKLGLRLERSEYDVLLETGVISTDVFVDLTRELAARERKYELRPELDLGLDPEKLVAKVPFLAPLRSEHIANVARLLKPRLAIPGETIVAEGETGRDMYFVSDGCVEVEVEPVPVQLGSGEFFGEIALLRETPRNANVTALGFCDLLTLSATDFESLLDTHPEMRETVERVASERLGEGADRR